LVYLSADELLALALPAVYLATSVWLLGRNQVAVVLAGEEIARVDPGSDFMLAGRRTVLANPLTPHHLVLRATWTLADEPPARTAESANAMRDLARALRPIGMLSAVAAAFAVVGAPYALLVSRSDWFLVCWSVCILLVLICGLLAFRRRAILELAPLSIVGIALTAAVCIPFAGHLSRSFGNNVRFHVKLPELAEHVLRSGAWRQFRERFLGVLENLSREVGEDSAASTRLDEIARHLRRVAS
jgi:hypothetical protein